MVVGVILIVWMCAILVRLYHLQIVEHDKYRQRAESQRYKEFRLAAPRGAIVDRNGAILAHSVISNTLVIDPELLRKQQADIKAVAELFAAALDEPNPADILARLSRTGTRYVRLRRRLEPGRVAAIREVVEQYNRGRREGRIVGVHFEQEPVRVYPNRMLASHIVGYVDDEEEGQAGLEKTMEERLRGEGGAVYYETDALGRPFDRRESPARDGARIVTTIDLGLQHRVEALLETAWRETRSKAASAVVMDLKTGEILSLANFPTYDPNLRPRARNTKEEIERELAPRRNRAVQDYYEPGSVFKVVTFAAALEDGLVRPDDKINCLNGRIELYGRVIRDHVSGWLPVTQAMAKSSNVGAIQLALKVVRKSGEDRLVEHIRSFGFGARTGIELPQETPGLVLPARRWHRTSIGSVAIGQEIGVTLLQLTAAMGVLGNRGLWVQPHLVRQVIGPDNKIIESAQPVERRAISERTAAEVSAMLEQVIVAGTARHTVKLSGYTAAGKTGTPQKINPATKRYSGYMPTFAGFVPASDPRYAIAVVLDEPVGQYYGGQVAAPVFKSIAETLLLDGGISPDQKEFRETLEVLVARLRDRDRVGDSADLQRGDGAPGAPRLASLSEDDVHASGAAPMASAVVVAAPTPAPFDPRVMPDFRGRSVREVAQMCTRLDLRVNLVGRGEAVRQSPAPGEPIEPGDICRVEFQEKK